MFILEIIVFLGVVAFISHVERVIRLVRYLFLYLFFILVVRLLGFFAIWFFAI